MQGICSASADENGFIMSYSEAYDLIKNTYSKSLQINDEYAIEYWQVCKKVYHANGFGIVSEDYDITQKELVKIGETGGLIKHVRESVRLPPMELVQTFAQTLKDNCLSETAFKDENGTYKVKGDFMNEDLKKTVLSF